MKPRSASFGNVNAQGIFLPPRLSILFAILVALLGASLAAAQTPKAPAPAKTPAKATAKSASQNQLSSPAIEAKVNALLAKMTLEEKIGQLVQYSAGAATGPTSGRTDDKDMIRKGQVGSLFNVTGARATNELQHIAVDESRLHIPL